jgi:hypothetical protein
VRAGCGDKPHVRFGRGRLMLLSPQDLASYLTSNAWGNAQDKVKGRRGGRTQPNGCGGCRNSPIPVEPHPRRAVCVERCLHGSGRGGWKRAVRRYRQRSPGRSME